MTCYATIPYAAAIQIIMGVISLRNISVCVLLASNQSLCLYSYIKCYMHATAQYCAEICNYLFGLRGCAAFPVIIS
jgi:hypothetical protein